MVTRRVTLPVLARLGGIASDQLAEQAFPATRQPFLVKQGETGLVEFAEEFLPRNFLEAALIGMRRVGKNQADDPGVIAAVGRLYGGRLAAARLGPFADLVVIGRDPGLDRSTL